MWVRRRGALSGAITLAVLLAAVAFLLRMGAPRPTRAADGPPTRILVIGGSAARGWRATKNIGYLDQAFQAYGERAGVRYRLSNRAIPGAGVRNPAVKRHYTRWLKLMGRGIVALAWGTLNDLRFGTPPLVVGREIRRECQEALHAGDIVLMITPIPTRASYTVFRTAQPRVVASELSAVEAVHDPDVHVLNLFSAMQAYLVCHHLTYRAVMHDNWDPGNRGHRIAALVLTDLLTREFGGRPITYARR